MPPSPGWITLHMQVTTPLFNGGADPGGEAGFKADDEAGVRPSSLRGAMRFWFRALVGIITGPDLSLLADLERKVFGHTEHASPVKLRIPRQPAVTPPGGGHDFLPRRGASARDRNEHPCRWIVYLLGQGLGDLRSCSVTRPYVPAGQDFDLKLRFSAPDDSAGDAIAALAVASLWLACAYGGAGGRVRRGFGGLRILGAEGWLPAPWDTASICSPSLDHYQQGLPHGGQPGDLRRLWPTGAVGGCISHLRQLVGPERFAMAQWPAPPPFPVLSRTHTLAGTSGGEPFHGWAAAAAYAGEQLRLYRASKDYPAAKYQPKIKTPEWDAVVHGPAANTRFPLGALGLPVVYKDHYTVNADRGPAVPLRRASPLWLRPVGTDDQWRLLSFAFCGQFLPGPDSPDVYLRHSRDQPRRLSVTDEDVVSLATQWITKLAADEWFEPGDRSSA
jgi:hypothetical protein